MKRLILLFAAGCAAVACQKSNQTVTPAKPIEMKAEYSAKTLSNRSFALELFKTTVALSGSDNVFISPYSINTAMNMVWNGAAGATAGEMSSVLGNDGYSAAQMGDYFKTLTDALLSVDYSTNIKIANSVWAHNTTPFKSSFAETNRQWYDAEVRNVDFTQQAALDAIDKWCGDNTAGKIKKISEGMGGDTRFALVNAVYFKGKWESRFKSSNTRAETFTNRDGTQSTVSMMNQTEDFMYSDDGEWKMLQLPYGNGAFSMVIVMPYENADLDAMTETLTADKFYSLLSGSFRCHVTLKLPKFKAEYAYMLHEEILPEMGMDLVFDPATADLSGMCDVPVYINSVIHKTYIDVYEEGTEAAAVTAGSGGDTSPGPGDRVDFFVDRPFIYSILENSTGTILFLGRMNRF